MRRLFHLFGGEEGSISTEYALVTLFVMVGLVLMQQVLERALFSYIDVFHYALSLPIP